MLSPKKELKLTLENLNLQWKEDRDKYVIVSGGLGKTYPFMKRDSEAEQFSGSGQKVYEGIE